MRFTCFLAALSAAVMSGQANAVHIDHHQLAQVDAFDNYQPLELLQLEQAAPKKEEAKKEVATKADADDSASKKESHDKMAAKIKTAKDKIAAEKKGEEKKEDVKKEGEMR